MATLPVTFALEPQYKQEFAKFLAEGFSPFNAAIRLWPHDAGLASQVAAMWPTDPYVTALQEKAKDEAEAREKPSTKAAQIKRIESKLSRMTDDTYLKAERLIAEMCGHIEKAAPPSVNIDNRSQVIERVMIYKDHGDDDDWEGKLARQQSKLIEGNVE